MNNIQKSFKAKRTLGCNMATGGFLDGVREMPGSILGRQQRPPSRPNQNVSGDIYESSVAGPILAAPPMQQPLQSPGLGAAALGRNRDASPLGRIDQQIGMGDAMAGLSNTDRYNLANPNNDAYGVGGAAPGSSAQASQMNRTNDIMRSLRSNMAQQPTLNFEDGTVDAAVAAKMAELEAQRNAAKKPGLFGGMFGGSKPAPAPAPVPAPAPSQMDQARSNRDALKQIANYAHGGFIREEDYMQGHHGYAHGGVMRSDDDGVMADVVGEGGPTDDDVPVVMAGHEVNVSDGEKIAVIPAKTAKNKKAMRDITKIIEESNDGKPVNNGLRKGYNLGGYVDDFGNMTDKITQFKSPVKQAIANQQLAAADWRAQPIMQGAEQQARLAGSKPNFIGTSGGTISAAEPFRPPIVYTGAPSAPAPGTALAVRPPVAVLEGASTRIPEPVKAVPKPSKFGAVAGGLGKALTGAAVANNVYDAATSDIPAEQATNAIKAGLTAMPMTRPVGIGLNIVDPILKGMTGYGMAEGLDKLASYHPDYMLPDNKRPEMNRQFNGGGETASYSNEGRGLRADQAINKEAQDKWAAGKVSAAPGFVGENSTPMGNAGDYTVAGTSNVDATKLSAPKGGGFITRQPGANGLRQGIFVPPNPIPQAADPNAKLDIDGNDTRRTDALKMQLAGMERDRYVRDMQSDITNPSVVAAAQENIKRMNADEMRGATIEGLRDRTALMKQIADAKVQEGLDRKEAAKATADEKKVTADEKKADAGAEDWDKLTDEYVKKDDPVADTQDWRAFSRTFLDAKQKESGKKVEEMSKAERRTHAAEARARYELTRAARANSQITTRSGERPQSMNDASNGVMRDAEVWGDASPNSDWLMHRLGIPQLFPSASEPNRRSLASIAAGKYMPGEWGDGKTYETPLGHKIPGSAIRGHSFGPYQSTDVEKKLLSSR